MLGQLISYVYDQKNAAGERALLVWGVLLVVCAVGLSMLFVGNTTVSTAVLGSAVAITAAFLGALTLLYILRFTP